MYSAVYTVIMYNVLYSVAYITMLDIYIHITHYTHIYTLRACTRRSLVLQKRTATACTTHCICEL